MEKKTIFGKVANYKELHVYQKSEVLVLLTDVFCKRFLPLYGDRRVDQMNMADPLRETKYRRRLRGGTDKQQDGSESGERGQSQFPGTA